MGYGVIVYTEEGEDFAGAGAERWGVREEGRVRGRKAQDGRKW